MARQYDWPMIRADYVEGIVSDRGERQWPSMRDLARLHDVPDSLLRTHAARDDWTGRRMTFQTNVDRDRQTMRIEKLSADAVELDTFAMTVAKAGLQLVQHRMGEIAADVQARRNAGDPASAIDANEAAALSTAGARWYALGKLALGDVPTQRIEHVGRLELAEPLDVELERLALEIRARAEEVAIEDAQVVEP